MNKVIKKNKVGHALKWSTLTELSTRLITPITNIILARLLVPEIFGVIASVYMVVSFVEMFSDAGFQKYLIQHEYSNENEKEVHLNVAFWTNFVLSIIIWLVIVIFKNKIAEIFGNPGLGFMFVLASLQLPISALASVQIALFRRDLNYKSLFFSRVVVSLLIFIVTVPLALFGFNYWSVIIGNLVGVTYNSSYLIFKSRWKPKLIFQFRILKEMFSFSIWTMIESIAIWFSTWLDIFIISRLLDFYFIGIYRTSINLVNSLFAIITSIIIPILFSVLSRLQKDNENFKNTFLFSQKLLAYIILPIGFGIYIYQDFITDILLGSNWLNASKIIGIWAITSSFRILLVSINSEIFRAKGKPKISLFLQIIDILIIIPSCIYSLNFGFWTFVFVRSIIRFDLIIPSLIAVTKITNIKVSEIALNLLKPFVITISMGLFSVFLNMLNLTGIWTLSSIFLCFIFYLCNFYLIDKKFILVAFSFIKDNG